MGLSLGTPITFDASGLIAIAALDTRRLLVIYSESGSNKIRVVDVINRVVGDGVVLTRGGADLVGVDDSRALVVYQISVVDSDPPTGQFCKVVLIDNMTISGIGAEATISSDNAGRQITLSKIQTRKAFVLYRDDTGSNKLKARIVNVAAATATPQAEIVIHTGTVAALNVETMGITGTNSIVAAWNHSSNRYATLFTTSGNTITNRDQAVMEAGSVITLTQTFRGLTAFNNIFATAYRKSGLDTIHAGIVVSNILGIGSPITGIDGTVMARLPGDKFVTVGDSIINQISAVNAVLTDNSIPIAGFADSSSPIGDCVALAFEDAGTGSVVMLTQQAQFYQGSGAFGGANRLVKKADLPIPGVKPNAIDISGSGLAVLGAQAGAPCQEEQVIVSAVEPYAAWENQSRNYPTGSAVTSVKFV